MKKAIAQIRKSLTNNIGLKISALLIASLVWLAVVNISDPDKTVTIYGIPITITHEDAIADLNMVYDAEDIDTVNITISGKRSIVSNLSASDFIATASLEELSKVNSVPVEVSSIRTIANRNITIVKQSVRTISLNVEELEQHKYPIEVEFSGDPAQGFVLGTYTTSKSTVQITAPASIHDRIEKVVAVCSLDNVSESISQKCILEMRDKHNKVIKEKHTTFSKKKVTVDANILKEKEVAISISPVGNVEDGFQITDVSASADIISIYGDENTVATVDKIEISDDIDVSGRNEDATFEIDLKEYLPDGVSIDGDTNLKITVKIERLNTKTIKIKTSDIKVNNLGKKLTAEFEDDTIEVALRGENAAMEELTADDLSASVDLKNYDEKRTVKVPVTIKLPDGVQLGKQINVKIKIK